MKEAPGERIEVALARSSRGDPSAFEALVEEHQAMVFSIAFNFLRDRAAAEDLAQEVFVELYRRLSSIKSAAHLKFWLRKTAAHRSIDFARRRKFQAVSLDQAPEAAAPAAFSDPVVREKLQQLVAALPAKPRMVVLLRYQEEMKLDEIAEILEMPINSVKSSLQRSLAILREKLTRCLGDVPV